MGKKKHKKRSGSPAAGVSGSACAPSVGAVSSETASVPTAVHHQPDQHHTHHDQHDTHRQQHDAQRQAHTHLPHAYDQANYRTAHLPPAHADVESALAELDEAADGDIDDGGASDYVDDDDDDDDPSRGGGGGSSVGGVGSSSGGAVGGELSDLDPEELGDLDADADSKQGFVEALIRLLEDSAHTHATQHHHHGGHAHHAADGSGATADEEEERKEDGGEGSEGGSPPATSAPFFSQSSLDAAFLLSCEGGHIRILYLLLPRISSLGVTNERGETGLHLAARNGHRDIVELLATQAGHETDSHGHARPYCAELELKAHDGSTPLYAAIANNQLHVAAYLLEGVRPRARVDISDALGESMLHLACRSGYAQLVLLLLRGGADARALNEKEEAPIDVAKNAEIARVLLEFQAQRASHAHRAAAAAAAHRRHHQQQQQQQQQAQQAAAADHRRQQQQQEASLSDDGTSRRRRSSSAARSLTPGLASDAPHPLSGAEDDDDYEEDDEEDEEDFCIPDEEDDEDDEDQLDQEHDDAVDDHEHEPTPMTPPHTNATDTQATPKEVITSASDDDRTNTSNVVPAAATTTPAAVVVDAATASTPSPSDQPTSPPSAAAIVAASASAPSSPHTNQQPTSLHEDDLAPREEVGRSHASSFSSASPRDTDELIDEDDLDQHQHQQQQRHDDHDHDHEHDHELDHDHDHDHDHADARVDSPLDFHDPLSSYDSGSSPVATSPFRQLPGGPSTTLFWTAIGVGADSAMFQPLGVFPFDRLLDTERVLVLAQVAEAMTGLGATTSGGAAQPPPELQPTVLHESALYAVFALMKLRIGREICPDPLPPESDHPDAAGAGGAGADVDADSEPVSPLADPATSTVWRQRVLEAYEQVYATSTALAGLRVSCTRLTVWSAVINLLARSLFGASFAEKKKIFTNPNGWERKLRQIACAKDVQMAAAAQAQGHPYPVEYGGDAINGMLRLPPNYFAVMLPATHSLEIQLTFKKLLLMSKTFLDPSGASGGAGGAKAGCFCRDCIAELEVPLAFKAQFMDQAVAEEKEKRLPPITGKGKKKLLHGKSKHSSHANSAEQREREKQHFQAHQQRLETTPTGGNKAHAALPPPPPAANGTSLTSSPPPPPPYTLDSLILTSGPELQNYWCGLSMEDKWALTELPLPYLHQLISRHLNWELLRAALESYEEYAWEEDVLELHEGQTITVADEMCEEGSMEDLLQAMIHAIHMRQLEERGEMDAQFEHALMRGEGASAQPLQLNLSASTQSARQMLENLVLSEFARKIAAAFLISKRESRAQQIALELEQELLAEEREAAAGAAGGKNKKKKLKAKAKKRAALASAASQLHSDDDDDGATPTEAEQERERERRAAQEAAAAKAAAEAAARAEAEAAAKAAAELEQAERERRKAEVREEKLRLKRERKLARKEERAALEKDAAVAASHTNDTTTNTDAAPETSEATEEATAEKKVASIDSHADEPSPADADSAMSTTTMLGPDGAPLNKKARRALVKAAREAALLEANRIAQERDLSPLDQEQADAAATAAVTADDEVVSSAAAEKVTESPPSQSPARVSAAGNRQKKSRSPKQSGSTEEDVKESPDLIAAIPAAVTSATAARRPPPTSFDDFECGVMLICSRDQVKEAASVGGRGGGGHGIGHAGTVSLKILGLPRKHAAILAQLTPTSAHHSTALFLFNVTDRLLHGVYYITDQQAATNTTTTSGGGSNDARRGGRGGAHNGGGFVVVPSLTPAPGTLPFPPSLRVVRFESPSESGVGSTSTPSASATAGGTTQVDPIPEAAFRHLFADGNRIRVLELRQVRELMAIFRARARNHRTAAANIAGVAVGGVGANATGTTLGGIMLDDADDHALLNSMSNVGGGGVGGALRTLTGITPIPLAISQPTVTHAGLVGPGGVDSSLLLASADKPEREGRRGRSTSATSTGTTRDHTNGNGREKRERGERGSRGGGGGTRMPPPYKSGISVLTPIVPTPMPTPPTTVIEPGTKSAAGSPDKSPWKIRSTDATDLLPPSHSHVLAHNASGGPSALEIIAATPHSHVLTAEYAPLGGNVSLLPRDRAPPSTSSLVASLASSFYPSSLAPSLSAVLDTDLGLGGLDEAMEFGIDSERMLQELEQWDAAPNAMDEPEEDARVAHAARLAFDNKKDTSSTTRNAFLPSLGALASSRIPHSTPGSGVGVGVDDSLFSFASGVKQALIDDGDLLLPHGGARLASSGPPAGIMRLFDNDNVNDASSTGGRNTSTLFSHAPHAGQQMHAHVATQQQSQQPSQQQQQQQHAFPMDALDRGLRGLDSHFVSASSSFGGGVGANAFPTSHALPPNLFARDAATADAFQSHSLGVLGLQQQQQQQHAMHQSSQHQQLHSSMGMPPATAGPMDFYSNNHTNQREDSVQSLWQVAPPTSVSSFSQSPSQSSPSSPPAGLAHLSHGFGSLPSHASTAQQQQQHSIINMQPFHASSMWQAANQQSNQQQQMHLQHDPSSHHGLSLHQSSSSQQSQLSQSSQSHSTPPFQPMHADLQQHQQHQSQMAWQQQQQQQQMQMHQHQQMSLQHHHQSQPQPSQQSLNGPFGVPRW